MITLHLWNPDSLIVVVRLALRVQRALDEIIRTRGLPASIRTDNGPEFISQVMKLWCESNRGSWHFIQPGKPTQNALIERVNGTLRKEVLDAWQFTSLREVRELCAEWYGQREELSTNFLNMCGNVFKYAMSAPSQQEPTTKGTLFGAYNAVTGYFQNIRGYKDDEAKFKSIMNGTGQIKAQKAFDLCTDFAKLGESALRLN